MRLNETGKGKCELGLGQQNLFPAARTLIACDVMARTKLSRFVVEARPGEPLVWNRGPLTQVCEMLQQWVSMLMLSKVAIAGLAKIRTASANFRLAR